MSFKQRLTFWNSYIYYDEPDSFPLHKDFPDDITGDINKRFSISRLHFFREISGLERN